MERVYLVFFNKILSIESFFFFRASEKRSLKRCVSNFRIDLVMDKKLSNYEKPESIQSILHSKRIQSNTKVKYPPNYPISLEDDVYDNDERRASPNLSFNDVTINQPKQGGASSRLRWRKLISKNSPSAGGRCMTALRKVSMLYSSPRRIGCVPQRPAGTALLLSRYELQSGAGGGKKLGGIVGTDPGCSEMAQASSNISRGSAAGTPRGGRRQLLLNGGEACGAGSLDRW